MMSHTLPKKASHVSIHSNFLQCIIKITHNYLIQNILQYSTTHFNFTEYSEAMQQLL